MLKHAFQVSCLTLISRILGYVRDFLLAVVVGASIVNDIFIIAFRLPNLFRSIFAEGAFNNAFIPTFNSVVYRNKLHGSSDTKYQKENAVSLFLKKIHILMSGALIVITLLSIIFMPQIISVTAPGFKSNDLKYITTILISRILFPYLILICLTAFYGSITNARERYFDYAVTPIILNIVMVIGLCLIYISDFKSIDLLFALCISVLIGGLLEFIWMRRAIKDDNLMFSEFFKFKTSWLRDNDIVIFFKKFIPASLSSCIHQCTTYCSMIFLSFIPKSLSYLYFADRIIQLPIALIGTALSTVALPLASNMYFNKNNSNEKMDEPEYNRKISNINSENTDINYLLNYGFIGALMLGIPSVIGIFMLKYEIIELIFGYGSFTKEAVINTSVILGALSFTIVPFILLKLFIVVFHGIHDTRNPLIASTISLCMQIVSSFILMERYGYIGIVYASIISSYCAMIYLYSVLSRINYFKILPQSFLELGKIFIAAISLILYIYIWKLVIKEFKIVILISLIGSSIVIYLGILYLLKSTLKSLTKHSTFLKSK